MATRAADRTPRPTGATNSFEQMIDPQTGVWKPQSSGIVNRVTGLLSQNNPLIQQARAQGLQSSNRRGLLNSSMGVQAGQTAAYGAALPIASQESDQIHQRNLQGAELLGAKDRLNAQLATQKSIAAGDASSRLQIAQMELSAREKQAGLDREHQLTMAEFDRLSRERIASMELSARDKQYAATAAAGFESTYAQMVSNIMNNAEIPAAERQSYLDHAAKIRDSNYALVEQIYGIDLNWGA